MNHETRIPEHNGMYTKYCEPCRRVLPLALFYKNGADGWRSVCKKCYDDDPVHIANTHRYEFDSRYRELHGTDPDVPSVVIPLDSLVKRYPTCNVCLGEFGRNELAMSLDHRTPIADPRSLHAPENVHLVHLKCNRGKHVKDLETYAMEVFLRDVGLKECTVIGEFEGCGETLPLENFPTRRTGADGARIPFNLCRDCYRAYERNRRRKR